MEQVLLQEDSRGKLAKVIESRAVYLLSMREHGDLELLRKLSQKFSEAKNYPDLVKTVLEICQKQGSQSDERYIQSYVRQAIAKGQGAYKIRQNLQGRTSQLSIVDAELSLDDEVWIELAQAVLEKKYGDIQKPSQRKEQAKRMRFLQSRGFTQSQIYKVFHLNPASGCVYMA